MQQSAPFADHSDQTGALHVNVAAANSSPGTSPYTGSVDQGLHVPTHTEVSRRPPPSDPWNVSARSCTARSLGRAMPPSPRGLRARRSRLERMFESIRARPRPHGGASTRAMLRARGSPGSLITPADIKALTGETVAPARGRHPRLADDLQLQGERCSLLLDRDPVRLGGDARLVPELQLEGLEHVRTDDAGDRSHRGVVQLRRSRRLAHPQLRRRAGRLDPSDGHRDLAGQSARDAGFDDRESDLSASSDRYERAEGVRRVGGRTLRRAGRDTAIPTHQ